MIQIRPHSRGISIHCTEGIDSCRALSMLSEKLKEAAEISGTRMILPMAHAPIVLEYVGPDVADWDAKLLINALQTQAAREAQEDARAKVAEALSNSSSSLKGYEKLNLLDRHQVEAISAITVESLQGIAIFDEQGTGKTISALGAFDVLRSKGIVKRLVVVAPKSVLASWLDQGRSFLGEMVRVKVVDGSAKVRRTQMKTAHDVLLISYDTLVRDLDLICMIIGATPKSYMLVVDESYIVKNPKTARAAAVAKLRMSCERAVVLCGTPAPNTPVDLVNQVDISDLGAAFSRRRISSDPEKAAEDVADGLRSSIYLRRLKQDVLPEIPAKKISKLLITLSPKQRAYYDAVRDELILQVRGIDDREFKRNLGSFLERRIRLLQICSNPSQLDPLFTEEPAKLVALQRLVEKLVVEQREKIVIWSYYRASLDAIAERFSALGMVRIDGSVSKISARMDAVNRFQKDPETRLFLGNAAAAGAGITLTAARHAIYESWSNQAAHFMQSVDRIHRRGQSRPVTSHILVAAHTIEERDFDRLLRKEATSKGLFGEKSADPITRQSFLEELAD